MTAAPLQNFDALEAWIATLTGREDTAKDFAPYRDRPAAWIEEQLGLTLRDEVRRVLLSLELADLEGGVSALVEEAEDLIVEVVDPGTPVVQVHKGS